MREGGIGFDTPIQAQRVISSRALRHTGDGDRGIPLCIVPSAW
jgi:hypothetical protein